MTRDRRCGDTEQVGFWAALDRFFSHGLVRGIAILLVAGTITGLASVLWTLPSKFAAASALEKKLDKDVYYKDQDTQQKTNNRLEGKIDDLIDLHLYPERAKQKILRQRNGG